MQNQVNSPTFAFGKNVVIDMPILLFGIFLSISSIGCAILYGIILLIFALIRDSIYQNTTFELSENSVKYRRDFFGVEQKSVRYVDIKEVVLKQSFAQKWYDIGSVEIKVFAAIASPGIELFDLKNYKEVYDFLLEKTKHNPVK